MKIVAKCGIEVVGRGIVRRGQTIELPEEMIDARIAAHFTAVDGAPLSVADAKGEGKKAKEPTKEETEGAALERTVNVLGREGIMRKLDDLGITYRPTHKTDYLAKLLLSAQGEM